MVKNTTGLFRSSSAKHLEASPQCATPPSSGKKREAEAYPDCPLAKRVPGTNRTGDEVIDLQRQGQRDDMISLLTLLWSHPDRINAVYQFAKRLGKQSSAGGSWATHPPNTIGQVPPSEIVVFFSKFGLDADKLDDMHGHDDAFLASIFGCALHVPTTLCMPAGFKEHPKTFWSWAKERATVVGGIGRVKKCLTNTYDKAEGGAYTLTWEEGVAVSAKHTAHLLHHRLEGRGPGDHRQVEHGELAQRLAVHSLGRDCVESSLA